MSFNIGDRVRINRNKLTLAQGDPWHLLDIPMTITERKEWPKHPNYYAYAAQSDVCSHCGHQQTMSAFAEGWFEKIQRWEVQTEIMGEWHNTWTEGEDEVRCTFDTKEEAEEALKEYLIEQHAAVDAGDMEEKYDPDTFRVAPVKE